MKHLSHDFPCDVDDLSLGVFQVKPLSKVEFFLFVAFKKIFCFSFRPFSFLTRPVTILSEKKKLS